MERRTLAGDRRPVARWRSGLAGGLALLALGAGCGSPDPAEGSAPDSGAAPTGAVTVLREATLPAGQPLPAPAGKPLLTLAGKVSATNKGSTVAVDRAGLARLGLVQVRVYEPWVKQDVDFRGVWLADLLEAAGAAADAGKVRITALDDYRVELTMADVRAGGILLATEAGDGSQIPIDKGGPTRIIFLDGVKAGANADQWIWSLRTIDVQ